MAPTKQSGRQRRQPGVVWALFRFDGRLSRQSYWLSLVFVWLVGKIALSPYDHLFASMLQGAEPGEIEGLVGSPVPLIIVLAVYLFSQLAIIIKRLHDLGLTGWYALVLLIPIVPIHPAMLFGLSVLLLIMLGVVPGSRTANRYGPAPDSRPA